MGIEKEERRKGGKKQVYICFLLPQLSMDDPTIPDRLTERAPTPSARPGEGPLSEETGPSTDEHFRIIMSKSQCNVQLSYCLDAIRKSFALPCSSADL